MVSVSRSPFASVFLLSTLLSLVFTELRLVGWQSVLQSSHFPPQSLIVFEREEFLQWKLFEQLPAGGSYVRGSLGGSFGYKRSS